MSVPAARAPPVLVARAAPCSVRFQLPFCMHESHHDCNTKSASGVSTAHRRDDGTDDGTVS